MIRSAAVLLIALLSGCASQPQTMSAAPSADPAVITSPDPGPASEASDIAMFAERVETAVALIVSSVLADGYSGKAQHPYPN